MAGLRVGRVDFLRRRIDVAEVLVEVDGHVAFGQPKTTRSRASVSFPPFLSEVLAEQVRIYPDPDRSRGLLFTSDEGTPLRRSSFRRRVWVPAVRAASLPEGTTPHHLRHACAGWLIDAGANPLEVAQKLRHSRVGTTLAVYGHLMDGTDDRVDGLLEDAWRGAGADSARTDRGHGRPRASETGR
jgi:integrase